MGRQLFSQHNIQMSNINKHSQILTFYHLNKLISVFKLKKYLQLDPTARKSIIIHFCIFIKMTIINQQQKLNKANRIYLTKPKQSPKQQQTLLPSLTSQTIS